MTNDSRPWPDLAIELRFALADGVDLGGTIDESDVVARVGSQAIEYVVEVSDLDGHDQEAAYAVLCDLLATRLTEGADQVLGCLVFASEPDAEALVGALDGMVRDDGVITPVLPLSRSQAEVVAEPGVSIDDFVDNATALIDIAADHRPPTAAASATLLSELDELVDRER